MPKKIYVYLDETDFRGGLLIGALVTEAPFRPSASEWVSDLIANPHCTERNGVEQRGFPQRAGLVVKAVAAGKVQGDLMVLSVPARSKGEAQQYLQAYAALVISLIWRKGLNRTDSMTIAPERFDDRGSELTHGRFEGLVGAFRWIYGDLPKVAVQAHPKGAGVLLAHGVVDAVLWNLRRSALTHANPERELLRLAGTIGVQAIITPNADAVAQASWLAAASGALANVDWRALARVERPASLPSTITPSIVASAAAALVPLADSTAKAKRAHSRFETLRGLLAQLRAGLTPQTERDRMLDRRLLWAEIRALSHLGRAGEAVGLFEEWNRLSDGPINTPDELADLLEGLLSQAVLAMDLRMFQLAKDVTEDVEKHLAPLVGSFTRIPVLGRALGARAQAYVLCGDVGQGLVLTRRSMAHFVEPADLSFGWTFGLVAIGRGAGTERDAELILRAALASADGLDLPTLLGANRFLAWGLSEVLCRFDRKEWLDAVLAAATHGGHPEPLIRRALGQVTQVEDHFQRGLAPLTPEALGSADAMAYMEIRTLVTWAHTLPGSTHWRAPLVAAQEAAGRALPLLQDLRELSDFVSAFYRLDPDDAAARAKFLALGGY